jgi:hypothetical protein
VRRRAGIARLSEFVAREQPTAGPAAAAAASVIAFGRIEQLRAQKNELKQKQPFFSSDKDLENAIRAIDRELARVQNVLDTLANYNEK